MPAEKKQSINPPVRRYKAISVMLETDMTMDQVRPLLDAIGILRGVSTAVPDECTSQDWSARERVTRELRRKLRDLLEPPGST